MPGKVNPTESEALTMVQYKLWAMMQPLDLERLSNFQLNVFMPMMIYNFLQSVRLL